MSGAGIFSEKVANGPNSAGVVATAVHRDGAERGAAEARHQRDHARALRLAGGDGVLAQELQRHLVRLGAARRQVHALEARAGQAGDALGQRLVRVVARVPHVAERELLALVVHGAQHALVALAEVGQERAGRDVHVARAVLVPEVDALAAHHPRHALGDRRRVEEALGPTVCRAFRN